MKRRIRLRSRPPRRGAPYPLPSPRVLLPPIPPLCTSSERKCTPYGLDAPWPRPSRVLPRTSATTTTPSCSLPLASSLPNSSFFNDPSPHACCPPFVLCSSFSVSLRPYFSVSLLLAPTASRSGPPSISRTAHAPRLSRCHIPDVHALHRSVVHRFIIYSIHSSYPNPTRPSSSTCVSTAKPPSPPIVLAVSGGPARHPRISTIVTLVNLSYVIY